MNVSVRSDVATLISSVATGLASMMTACWLLISLSHPSQVPSPTESNRHIHPIALSPSSHLMTTSLGLTHQPTSLWLRLCVFRSSRCSRLVLGTGRTWRMSRLRSTTRCSEHRWRWCMVNIWSGLVRSRKSVIVRMLWDLRADENSKYVIWGLCPRWRLADIIC